MQKACRHRIRTWCLATSTTLHWNRETGPPLRILALHHHLTPVENFFNLLRYSGSTVELETYKAIAGDTFTKIASWEADISLEDDGPPSMSEWSRKE